MDTDYTISDKFSRKPRSLNSNIFHPTLCSLMNKWRKLIKSLPCKWLRQMGSFKGPRSNFVHSHPLKIKFERHHNCWKEGKMPSRGAHLQGSDFPESEGG